MTDITDFCERHNACNEGVRWAKRTGCTTMEELWLRDDMHPEYRIWIFTRKSVSNEATRRLFAVWCARQVQHLMEDERSVAAIDVAERYANGEATEEEFAAASAAARDSASTATWDSARDAARDAAASAAAWDAAAWTAASASASASAKEAAREAQANRIMEIMPTFDVHP